MLRAHTNWSGNLSYDSKEVLYPQNVSEIQNIVTDSIHVKVLGTRHCFNDIADCSSTHISLERLNKVLNLDRDNLTATIEGGVRYGELANYLYQQGYALANLASLPHINVAGAIATATHGSGVGNQNLSAAVVGMKLVTSDGAVVHFSRQQDPERFPGLPVHLGALGVVTELTLKIEPSFDVRQDIYENLPLTIFTKQPDEILSSAYSVSLFTDWRDTAFHQVWLKSKSDQLSPHIGSPSFFGATPARANLHPLPNHPAENCTQQLGTPGPWHERLPHFKLEYTPSSGEELQSEYFIPISQAAPAIETLFAMRSEIYPLAFVSELRSIAADDLWLSPAYEQDCLGIHITWKPKQDAVLNLLPKIEAQLAPFSPRPHWGKLHTVPASQIRPLYPHFAAFRKLAHWLDPRRKFENRYLASILG